MVAEPDQQQRGAERDLARADHPAPPSRPLAECVEGRVHDVSGQPRDEGVGPVEVEHVFGHRQVEPGPDLVPGVADQLPGGAGNLAEVEPDLARLLRDDGPQRPERVRGEPGDVDARADGVADRRQLAAHLLDLDRLLGEHRAGPLLAVRRGFPVAEEGVPLGLEVAQREERLLGRDGSAPQQQPLHDRLEHLVRVRRDRDRDPQRAADRLVLAEQDVEHDPVDLVVDPVVGQHPDDLGGLAVAVNPALALLVAGRVPAQVVVDDGVEVVLEVDPLADRQSVQTSTRFGAPASWSTRSSRSAGASVPVTASTSTALGQPARSSRAR